MQRHIEALEEQNRLLRLQVESTTQSENTSKLGATEKLLEGASETKPEVHYYSEFYVPVHSDLRDIKQSIVDAGLHKKWAVIESSDSLVVLHLKHRDFDTTLYFEFDIEKIVLYSDSLAKIKPSGWWKPKIPMDGFIFCRN